MNVHLGSSVRSRTTSSSTSPEFSPMPLSAEHNPEICLQCGRLRSLDVSIQISEIAEGRSAQNMLMNDLSNYDLSMFWVLKRTLSLRRFF